MKLDKSNWKPATFGEVVRESRETVKDPQSEGLDRVVGLEHIETECIHLRSWAPLEEGTTFTKRFRKGQVLFGRRRAYLKKAAQANFDGICSGDITVMEAKKGLLPELLPFLVCNDKFFDHAVKHSAGGLSPRAKFKDLATYEFLLPPKDQQAKLAELLWAGDSAIENFLIALQKIERAKESLISQHLSKIGKDDVERLTIADLAAKNKNSCCGGPFGSDLTGKDYVSEAGVPVIRGANLTKGGARFVEEEFVYVSKDKGKSLEKNSARRDDIIVTQRGTLGQVGLIPKTSKHEKYIVSQSQMKLTVDPEVAMPEFVYYYLLSKNALRHLEIVTISTGVPHINLGIFKQFPIPVPPLATQESIVKSLNQIDGTIDESQRNIFLTKGLSKSLINQIF